MTEHYYDAVVLFGCTCGSIGKKKDLGPCERKYLMGAWHIEDDAVLTLDLTEPGVGVAWQWTGPRSSILWAGDRRSIQPQRLDEGGHAKCSSTGCDAGEKATTFRRGRSVLHNEGFPQIYRAGKRGQWHDNAVLNDAIPQSFGDSLATAIDM